MGLRVTNQALDAYRERVRSPAYWIRWAGAFLIIAGAACIVGNYSSGAPHGTPLEIAGAIAMAAGWALIAVAFAKRNAYHRRRPGS